MKLLLIDSTIIEYDKIAASAKDDVKVIIFNKYTDTFESLQSNISKDSAYPYTCVGIVQHGNTYAPYYKFLDTQLVPARIGNVESEDPTLESWSELQMFYKWLKESTGAETIDFISCALLENPGWVYVIQNLESKLEMNFRASSNNTGNIASGGDWVQETDGVNIQTIYFTDMIEAYVGLLYSTPYRKSSQMVCAPGASVQGQIIKGSITTNANITKNSLPENMVLSMATKNSAYAWGDSTKGGNNTQAQAAGSDIIAIASTERAFAALKSDGTVYAWGDSTYGGDNTQAQAAGNGIVALATTPYAFAALKSDGTVYAWGNSSNGGDNTQAQAAGNGIVAIASTFNAFAALKSDGTVYAWGNTAYGGNNTQAQAAGSGIVALASTERAFAALKSDGTVYAWGDSQIGGNNTQASAAGSGIVALASHGYAFAALKSDGTVYAWGDSRFGGNNTQAQAAGSGIVALASNSFAFAALKSDGTVYAWGNTAWGGDNTQASAAGSGIVALASTFYAFAALKSDGTVYAWGSATYGGDNTQASAAGTGIVALASTTFAFAALKSDGTVYAWGNTAWGGDNTQASAAGSGIVALASTFYAFAALKSDGTVYAWGSTADGGNNTQASAAGSGIVALASTPYAFAALKPTPIPADATSAVSSGFVGNLVAISKSSNTSLSLSLRSAITYESNITKKTAARSDFIKGMRDRLQSFSLTIPSSDFNEFKATLQSGADELTVIKPILQYFPIINIFDTAATLEISSFTNIIGNYVCIELPINIPTTLTENGVAVATLFYDGTNVSDGTGIINVGSEKIFGSNIIGKIAIGSLTGLVISLNPTCIAYGQDKWLAANMLGSIKQSTNGITWNSILLQFSISVMNVAFNGTIWLIVGGGAETIAYSYDGINWIPTGNTLFTGGTVNSVVWNGRLWVAGAGDITIKLGYSYDGVNWFAGTNSALTSEVNSVKWTGSRWIAVGSGTNTIASSPDGITWTGVTNSVLTGGGNDVACTLSVGYTYIQHPAIALGQYTRLNIGIITYNWIYQDDPGLTSFTFVFNGGAPETLSANTRTQTYRDLAFDQSYTASIRANFGGVSSDFMNFEVVNL